MRGLNSHFDNDELKGDMLRHGEESFKYYFADLFLSTDSWLNFSRITDSSSSTKRAYE